MSIAAEAPGAAAQKTGSWEDAFKNLNRCESARRNRDLSHAPDWSGTKARARVAHRSWRSKSAAARHENASEFCAAAYLNLDERGSGENSGHYAPSSDSLSFGPRLLRRGRH